MAKSLETRKKGIYYCYRINRENSKGSTKACHYYFQNWRIKTSIAAESKSTGSCFLLFPYIWDGIFAAFFQLLVWTFMTFDEVLEPTF